MFDGFAKSGVLIITCMDSRIVPLEMVGLTVGDAKIIRTPGGRVTTSALAGCIAGVHLLNVDATHHLLGPQTAASYTANAYADACLGRIVAAIDDAGIRELRNHPLIGDRAVVGGFYYDVDTGLLERWD